MKLTIPDLSLVLLIGAAGSGKTKFANRRFRPSEILSIEQVRAMVADDHTDANALDDAFAAMSYLAMRRLAAGRVTVIDDRHLNPNTRQMLVGLAREYHVIPVAIVFHMAESVLLERNRARGSKALPGETVLQQARAIREIVPGLPAEGFRHIYEILTQHEAETLTVVRQPLWNRRTDDHGPFDIIGDVHGCYDELRLLLQRLGYLVYQEGDSPLARHSVEHPMGRRLVFLGDLAGHGPKIVEVLRLVMDAVDAGIALTVPGDHDARLVSWLQSRGTDADPDPGLAASMEQVGSTPEEFRQEVQGFLSSTVSHYLLDEGRLVVAHAGLKEELHGRASLQVRKFAIHGEAMEFERSPSRPAWPQGYHGAASVVYGHTPVTYPEWVNRTMNIDTGCVHGGRLTCLRYPEKELVSVDAVRAYVSILAGCGKLSLLDEHSHTSPPRPSLVPRR